MHYKYLNDEEIIKSTITFDETPVSLETSPLHIAYGVDKNFLFGCGVSITSVLINNSMMNFVFHIFIDEISEVDKNHFLQLAQSFKTCIQIHIVNCDRLREFPTTKNWSVAMYFRFIIGDYFIGQQERILYLDADIVCQGKINSLMTIPLDGNVAGVVVERDNKWWALRAKSLECAPLAKGYFNSGVLLLNIAEWAKYYVSGKAMLMLSDKNITQRLTYMDQDILNIILIGKVKFIDSVYNTQFSINYELKSSFVNPINENTALIHYVGPTKPWHEWSCYPSCEPFRSAKAQSPWKDEPLMKPTNSNYARYCAKHNFKQERALAGIKNYLYYFYLKMIK